VVPIEIHPVRANMGVGGESHIDPELLGNAAVFPLRLSYGAIINYSYLVIDQLGQDRDAVLIDPAWEPERVHQAVHNARAHPVAVLVTHAHPDHTDLADEMAKYYDVPVFMEADEIDYRGFFCANLEGLEDGDRIDFGQSSFVGILTPGHTLGRFCFLGSREIFTGDTVFMEGCGICTPGGTPESLYASLRRLREIVSGGTRVFPGHRYSKPLGGSFASLLAENMYFNIADCDEFVAVRMRPGQTGLWAFT